MKPLTNETLIEEKIRALVKELFYLAHVDYDENMAEANMTPPDEEGVRIIKGFLDSALQAKERVMVEKFKEIIGEDEKSVAEETGRPFRNEHFETPIKREARNQLRAELRSKLSNLSEK